MHEPGILTCHCHGMSRKSTDSLPPMLNFPSLLRIFYNHLVIFKYTIDGY